MISYTKNELIPATEFAKNIDKFLNSVKNRRKDKIALVRNDRPEAVIINIDEYEYLCKAYELSEHTENYETIRKRQQTLPEEYVSHEEMLQKFDKNE